MEATLNTKGIILRREYFLENNSRVFIYTRDFGKVDLIARGSVKLSSKIAAHIEPLNLCDLMIVKGKQYDYLGSCVSEDIFGQIKKSYSLSCVAGDALKLTAEIIKGQENDEHIFMMLKKFLQTINDINIRATNETALRLLSLGFTLKLISMLGYQPNLQNKLVGNAKINNLVSDVLQKALQFTFVGLLKISLPPKDVVAAENIVYAYKAYLFD